MNTDKQKPKDDTGLFAAKCVLGFFASLCFWFFIGSVQWGEALVLLFGAGILFWLLISLCIYLAIRLLAAVCGILFDIDRRE